MFKKLAYKVVFNDLKKCPMFCGIYDAKNGKKSFMYGIETVMETIGYKISEETAAEFDINFLHNVNKSVDKSKEM